MKDAILISRLQLDDKEAFERLFRRYHEAIYRFLHYFIGASDREAPETAKDLMQDVFLKIWEHRHELDCKQPIRPYLFKIARNQAISYLRHQRTVDQWKESISQYRPAGTLSPETIMEGMQLQSEIRKAIHELPERCALIFVMSRYEGLSYREIAEVLNLSLQTVKNQMSKSLAILKKKLSVFILNF